MRNVLTTEGSMKNIVASPGAAALVGFLLVLPLAILESLNNTVTRQNAPGLIMLFGLLWLLPAAFIAVLAPVVRTARAGHSVSANPINLLFRIAFLALIAAVWVSLLIDQMPCFMGVPNCD